MARPENGSWLSRRLAGQEDAGNDAQEFASVIAGVMAVRCIGSDDKKSVKKKRECFGTPVSGIGG